jgi:hypothetical protein
MSARRRFPVRTVLLALVFAPGFASASGTGDILNPKARVEPESQLRERSSSWRFGMGLGYKHLETAWVPADHQVGFTVMDAAYRPHSWPLALTLGIGVSVSAAVPRYAGVKADFCNTYEVSAGVRGEWPEGARTRVFAGTALAVMGASATNSHAIAGFVAPGFTPVYEQEDSAGPGARIETGVTRPLGHSMRIGVRGTWSRGRVTLFGRHLDPGGAQAEALVFWGR